MQTYMNFRNSTKNLVVKAYFTLKRLQFITRQCLEALQYLHNLGIVHCDLKPENVPIKSYKKCEIKIIDLGSSCFKTDNLYLYVQSWSYRASEVMLGLQYDEKIDDRTPLGPYTTQLIEYKPFWEEKEKNDDLEACVETTKQSKMKIHGYQVFNGCNQQQLLSIIFSIVLEDYETTMVQLLKQLKEGQKPFEETVFVLKGIGIYLLISAMGICKGKHYELIFSCRKAVITAWRTHKGKSPSACSQWEDIELWCQSHIILLAMVWKVQLCAASRNLLTYYGNIDNALKLFHDMQEMDMVGYSTLTYGCGMYCNTSVQRNGNFTSMAPSSDEVDSNITSTIPLFDSGNSSSLPLSQNPSKELEFHHQPSFSLHFIQWDPEGWKLFIRIRT